MISYAIDICKNVIDFVLKKQSLKQDQKERISQVLDEISMILNDTGQKLIRDEYPHMNCVILERLSNNLHLELIDHVDQNDLDNLHKALLDSSNIEKEYASRKEKDTIPKILSAAGEFKALSLSLKI